MLAMEISVDFPTTFPLGMKYPFPVKFLIGMSSEIIPLRLVEDHKTDQQFTQRHFYKKNPEGLPPGDGS